MNRLPSAGRLGLGIIVSILLAGCLSESSNKEAAAPAPPDAQASTSAELPTVADDKPRDFAGLHNVVAYSEGFLSGSVPEGDAGFDTLADMGVKTIISVDGAEPDVELAKARGMRYIHLPIGYNGFDEQRKLELVRATRDAMQDGPVYVHCHHGKHRSAGAAGTVAVSLGWGRPDQMIERMKVSGTAPNYKGLYACTSNAATLGESVIDAVPADFPEVSRPTSFVKGMVEIDDAMEHLKAIEKASWNMPTDHPDLVPVAEAGRMADLFRVLSEGDRVKGNPPEFAMMMQQGGSSAQALEDMLAADALDARHLSEQFKRINASCKDCHVKYRD